MMRLGDLIVIIGLLQISIPEYQEFLPHVPPAVWGLITVTLGLAVKVLRALTTEPVETFLNRRKKDARESR